MILAELTSDVPKTIAAWLGCLAFVLLTANEAIKFLKYVRGKAPEPSNEILGHEKKGLSRRLHIVEGSIRKIYEMLGEQKDDFTDKLALQTTDFAEKLTEQTGAIIAAGGRRQETIDLQFKEIAASLATLKERTKHL